MDHRGFFYLTQNSIACKRKEEQQTPTSSSSSSKGGNGGGGGGGGNVGTIVSQGGGQQQQPSTPKKPRLVFTDLQRRTLQAIFKETKRPSKEMQITISQQLGLDLSTVGNFFMNARRRSQDKWMDDSISDADMCRSEVGSQSGSASPSSSHGDNSENGRHHQLDDGNCGHHRPRSTAKAINSQQTSVLTLTGVVTSSTNCG